MVSDKIRVVGEGAEVSPSRRSTALKTEAATAILLAACIETMVWLTAHGLCSRLTWAVGGGSRRRQVETKRRLLSLHSQVGLLFQTELREHVSVPKTMPGGAPFHSFIRPYPIRVDAFATPADALDYQVPCLHLLTHAHTDHLVGLSSNSFGAVVVCSPAAKEMLLNFEPTHERIAYDKGQRRDRLRPYANLRIDPIKTNDGKMDYSYARDLLVSMSIGLYTLLTYHAAPNTLEHPI